MRPESSQTGTNAASNTSSLSQARKSSANHSCEGKPPTCSSHRHKANQSSSNVSPDCTNTPRTIIIYQDSTPVAIQIPPVPLTPYVLIDDLRRESTEYEATKEATTNAGRDADTMEDPIRKTFITVDSLERSDEVATFLESRSVVISSKNENPSYAEFVVVAYVPRSLLRELSYMEGITRIEAFPGPLKPIPRAELANSRPHIKLQHIIGAAT